MSGVPSIRYDPTQEKQIEESFDEFPDGFYIVGSESGYWVGPFATAYDREKLQQFHPMDRLIRLERPAASLVYSEADL